ncbi:uncharacterized protein PAF06_007759 [Gastrophryne carolinensis]
MASKRHFSISKAVLDQISDSGSDTEPLAEMSDSDSWQDSSSDSDTDQRSGDSDNSAPDLSDVRTWCPIDCGMDEMTSLKRLSRRQIATTSSNPQLCFLGLILLTGVVGKPLQKWYWTTNKLLATPFFGTIMSECRFSLIMKNLHFTNNEEFDEATHPAPKLKKIWEVYQMILKNFQQSYVPDRDISIDESLMAYKGRLSWIQFIASKRARPLCPLQSIEMFGECTASIILKSKNVVRLYWTAGTQFHIDVVHQLWPKRAIKGQLHPPGPECDIQDSLQFIIDGQVQFPLRGPNGGEVAQQQESTGDESPS